MPILSDGRRKQIDNYINDIEDSDTAIVCRWLFDYCSDLEAALDDMVGRLNKLEDPHPKD